MVARMAAPSPPRSPSNPPLPIVLVDDDPRVASVLRLLVGRLGVAAEVFNDPEAALGYLQDHEIAALICDYRMPTMDGLKLTSMVRKDEVHKAIPIVIITTEGAQEDRQRALSLGANAYITKPIQAPQVISKVKELLKM